MTMVLTGTFSIVVSALMTLGAVQVDEHVLHLRELLFKRKQTACLARVRFGRKRFREGGGNDQRD